VLIDGLRTKPDEGYQVFDVTTMGSALASNFCNDHNFKVGDASGQVGYDRQGGPRYCEVLVFTNQLTAMRRGEVLDYLSAKWMVRSRRAGGLASVNGSRLEADVGAGQTLAVGKLSGEGCLTKTGEGTLQFANDPALFRGAVRLSAGTVESTLQRTDRAFVVETGGQVFETGTSAVSRTALADATLFQKTGSGTLTLAGISNSVSRVDVMAGTLRLSAPFVPTTEVVRVSVPNASFEDHAAISSGTFQTALNPTGWTLITSGSNGKGGITLDRSTTPWVTQGAIPDGESAVFFQYDGGVKTTVTVSRAGIYRLSFQAAGRGDNAGYRQHDFGVWLGTQKVAVAKTCDPVFKRYEYVTPSLTNGAHELRFQGLVGTVNRASVIDDVRLDLKETAVAVDLPNGGFESSDHFGTDSVPTVFAMSPTNAEWTFEGSNLCGIAEATPSVVPGTYFTRNVPEGTRCAFIQSNAVIRQTFRFPTTGEVYRLSFQTAGREKYEGHAFKVLIDGVPLIPYMRTALSTFHACSVTLPPVTNWAAEIAFVGVSTNSATLTSLFDDIRIVRADDVTVPNGSFETTTSLAEGDTSGYATLCEGAGWTFEQDDDARKPGISGTGFGAPPLGRRVAFIQGYAVIRQTLTLPGAGTYLLSFQAAGRPGYLGHAIEVCWGGTRLGVVTADSAAFRTYTFRLPYVAGAASKELLFRGLVRLPIFSLIDDVKIERTVVGGIVGLLPKTADVSVASGAKLDLDFSGTLTVKSVTLGNREKSRIISAETCPEYVTGTGALYTPAKGTIISVQ
jgi:autotransporter-associated beta strand protein